MKDYEKLMFRVFPELGYLVDYLWTPGSPEPYHSLLAVVNRLEYPNPIVENWLGDNEPEEVIEISGTVPWPYEAVERVHKDLSLLEPSAINLVIKNMSGEYLLLADTTHKRVYTSLGAIHIPEIRDYIKGIFADILLPKIMGKMATVKIEFDAPSVEEEKVKFLADAMFVKDRLKYQAEITRLNRQIEKLKNQFDRKIADVIYTIIRAKESGWEVELDGSIVLRYPHKIPLTQVVYQNEVYDIPEDLQDRFYTELIVVRVNEEGRVYVNAWGKHPNIGGMGQVCLGDFHLTLKNFDDLLMMPANLEVGNLDSPLSARVASEIIDTVIKGAGAPVKKKGLIINV